MKTILRLFALSLVPTLVACTPPAAQESSTLAAMTQTWSDHFNAGDAAALSAMYTEDCRLLPPNAELLEGRGAVEADFKAMIASGVKLELENVEAMVAGDLGHKVGRYKMLAPDGAVLDRGKFIETWRRVGGEWKISNDTYNSDLSPGAGATTLIVTHEVRNADRWMAAWTGPDSRHGMFAEHGAPRVRVFRSEAKANLTGLLIDIEDMDAFTAFMASPEVAAAKAEDGVRDATLRTFTEIK